LGPRRGSARWRGPLAGPVVAVVAVLAALPATHAVGLPLRDPDHVAALYLVLVGFGVIVLVGLDILVRAARSSGRFPPSRAAVRRVRRERWTLGRGVAAGSALLGFYVTYMAYRNLKSVVPLLRPGELFDRQLADLDRSMFGGHDPAALLHTLLGTGIQTHLLSAAYVAFIVFLPLTIGLALVFSRDLQAGLFYTTAQSINWVLGAASYFLLPSLGPVFAEPAAFVRLPASEVTHLQSVLLDQRLEFLRDPATGTPQSIAGFASLHISMSFTAAVAAHLLGLRRPLKIGLWIWFAVTTVATIYLGWHYVLDDLAGVILGAIALALAAALTGIDLRTARQRRRATGPVGMIGPDGDTRPATRRLPTSRAPKTSSGSGSRS
jgi:membrane-associated phospholipid phosphatase